MRPLKLDLQIESWPLKTPFRITGYTWNELQVLRLTLEHAGHIGAGEAAGVYYRGDEPKKMVRQLEKVRGDIESGITRSQMQELLGPGGARNALDCAMWDLEAKVTGVNAYAAAGLEGMNPLVTTFTCGADTPSAMASVARGYTGARAIKVKLTGEDIDAERIRAIRTARPEVWLGVDGNQGFTRDALQRLLPTLLESNVSLIEQPFPAGKESLLDGLQSPIRIAADESVQDVADLPAVAKRVNVVNIKLDKCGGLTAALLLAREAQGLGLEVMVGNMLGTSLAMAPAFLLGQLCKVVDLDGPIFLRADREKSVEYRDGRIECPPGIWGTYSS